MQSKGRQTSLPGAGEMMLTAHCKDTGSLSSVVLPASWKGSFHPQIFFARVEKIEEFICTLIAYAVLLLSLKRKGERFAKWKASHSLSCAIATTKRHFKYWGEGKPPLTRVFLPPRPPILSPHQKHKRLRQGIVLVCSLLYTPTYPFVYTMLQPLATTGVADV